MSFLEAPHPQPIFWLDLAKTLIGAFLGAGLAFASNLWFQYRQRRRDNLVAGNVALFTLARQWGDYMNARRGFLGERQHRLGANPLRGPHWLQFSGSGRAVTVSINAASPTVREIGP